jgi:thioredoxin-related protein
MNTLLSFIILVTLTLQDKNENKFDPSRDPEKDLKEALKEAKETDKRILLDVGGEWCIWCHYLDDFFEENKDIDELMRNNFVVIKINYSPENENKKFLSRFPQIPGYPHLFVLNQDGKLLHSQGTAELEKGRGYDRGKVFDFLKKWAP